MSIQFVDPLNFFLTFFLNENLMIPLVLLSNKMHFLHTRGIKNGIIYLNEIQYRKSEITQFLSDWRAQC